MKEGGLFGKLFPAVALLIITLPSLALAQSFERITGRPVVTDGGWSLGTSMVDINGDDLVDIYVSNGGEEKNFLYMNNGDGSFEKVSDSPLLKGYQSTNNSSWADYNNDGQVDAYITNSHYQDNKLFRGTENSFDYLSTSLPSNDGSSSLGASWGDFNGDQLLDLFVANGYYHDANILYKNNGDGTFTALENSVISSNENYSYQGSWVDIDKDQDLDLYVVNSDKNENSLFINDGGSFTQRFEGPLVNSQIGTNGASWGDFDNDRDLDLFVNNGGEPNQLFKNNGDGTFVEVTDSPVVADTTKSSGSCWADFNNDGYLDLYVVLGRGSLNIPNRLYMNQGDGTFSEVQTGVILDAEVPNNGVSTVCDDYNRDGYQDVFVANYKQDNELYKNTGTGKNWLSLKLVGTESNKSAIGSKVSLLAELDGQKVWQYRTVRTESGHRAQKSLRLHFGLADASRADSVVIRWPDGDKRVLTNVNSNQFLSITEDSSQNRLSVKGEEIYTVPGDTVHFPVSISTPEDSSYTAFEFSFRVDADLPFLGVNTKGGLLENKDWIISDNRTDTTLNISAAGSDPIRGSDTLFTLQLVVPETATGTYPIKISKALFDQNEKPDHITHGSITIPAFGDIDFNSKIQAFDASVLLKNLVGKVSLSSTQKHFADVSRDSGVTSLDASLILQHTTGKLDTLPLTNSTEKYVADGSLSIGSVTKDQNGVLTVPFYVSSGENIYSFESSLSFDTSLLKIKKVVSDESADLSLLLRKTEDGGQLVGATTNKISGETPLFYIKFEVNHESHNNQTSLGISKLRWNEDKILRDVARSTINTQVSIPGKKAQLPKQVTLKSNYPNPFNPTTTIPFILPEAQNVSVTVYNTLGQKVEQLVNKRFDAGRHQVTFKAKNIPSGVYIYKLTTKRVSRLGKMLLVK